MALQDDINNFTSSCTVGCLLTLAACVNNTTTNRIVSVATVNDLPDLNNCTIAPGTIFYVDSIRVPVIAHFGCWTGLDNRLLRKDITCNVIYSWGCNSQGRLGDGTVTTRSSPVSVVGGFTDWCQISAGWLHGLGVRTNGTLWAWGGNGCGQLGINTTADRSSPVSVVGGFTDWCQVSAGDEHSLGVRTDGTAWSWGNGGFGRLGNGFITTRSSPTSVAGGFTDWRRVSAGVSHSLGLRSNGTVWAWGYNGNGRLGDGTVTTRSSPVSVVGGFTDWCHVSAGLYHSLGVRTNGTAWAWGCNGLGRLGDGTTVDKSSPVSIVGGFTDWCQLAGSFCQSLGVRTNGTLWAWGRNTYGQLGDGTTVNKSSPVSVVGGFTDWCQVSAQLAVSHGLRTNGTAWSWGCNSVGQLGDNTVTNKSSPVSVAGGFTDWCQISGAAPNGWGMAIRKF